MYLVSSLFEDRPPRSVGWFALRAGAKPQSFDELRLNVARNLHRSAQSCSRFLADAKFTSTLATLAYAGVRALCRACVRMFTCS